MVRRQLKLRAAGVARAFSTLVFFVTCVAVLNGCNGVSGDAAGLAPREQPPAGDNAALARAANKFVSASTPGSAGYLVGPQDVLDITVYQAPDLSKTVQVGENGVVNLPLVNQVPAAGKTPSQIERDLQARLGARFMKSPQVTVFVKEFNSQRVTVEGAVKTPGVLPLRGNDTLMQVIAKSGGLDRTTASDNVVVFHTASGAGAVTRYDLAGIRSGEQPDPTVMPGDVVVVDDSTAKVGLNFFLRVLPVAGYASYVF